MEQKHGAFTTREEKRIEAGEMEVLRTIVGKMRRDRVRNEWVRERVGVVPVLNRIDSARLRWWGHIVRMPGERVASRRWWWRVEGVRPRGRWKDLRGESPEKTWTARDAPANIGWYLSLIHISEPTR